MAEVRTEDEAIELLQQALERWSSATRGVLVQAASVARSTADHVQSVRRERAARLSSLQARLVSLRPDDDPGPLLAAIDRATDALRRADRAAALIEQAVDGASATQRQSFRTTEEQVSRATASLRARLGDLADYRSRRGGDASPAIGALTSGNGRTSSTASGKNWLESAGMEDVDLDKVDYSDNPIIGEWGRGGASKADYRWAVETWEEVVRPGIENGKDRSHFEARDSQRNASNYRRTASVYDMFTGSDRIKLDRRSDGTFSVIGGRHRIEAARELGITRLPGEVFG